MDIEIPEKLLPLYSTDKRFIDLYGGRGGAKSHGVATFLLCKSQIIPNRILCCREIQGSIKDSVWQLLTEKINYYGWDRIYDITDATIICKRTGCEFIFKGLRRDANDIKSIENIQYAWVEEAQSVSRKSLKILVPTVRNPGSQIIFTYNPTTELDPVHADYTLVDRDDTLKININWRDNPWFPDVLRQDMEYDKNKDYDDYLHVWEGECQRYSNEQIGAFDTVQSWDAQYSVAFIDPSFSDKQGTDATACSILGVTKNNLIFTGMKWPKSIADDNTRKELLDFLNIYTPIETILESQLGDSTIFFIDAFKRDEFIYKIKNQWSWKHQTINKHERISSTVIANKKLLKILEGTQQEYSLDLSRYRKGAEKEHKADCADSLAGAYEALGTSEIVAEYVKALNILYQRK